MNSFTRFLKSLTHAKRGLFQAIAAENSFRIHLAAALVVIMAMLWLEVERVEMAIIIFLISSVLSLELVNTVVERFVDMLEPRVHPYAGQIKDLLAATVLLTALASVAIGLLIFWPYVQAYFSV